jgi:outer membrane protein TolC
MKAVLLAALLAAAPPSEAPPATSSQLSVEAAVRAALATNPALAGGRAAIEARHSEVEASDAARLPTLAATAQATFTDDPLAVFGMRLQERDVAASDFAPDKLNHPGFAGSVGVGLEANLPLYTGGKLSGARDAARAAASSSEASQRLHAQQLALRVVGTYFRAVLLQQAVQFAQDSLGRAEQTQRFAEERVKQSLLLPSEVSRAVAFRAQASAELEIVRQRLADARDELGLLVGDSARDAQLTTPVEGGSEAGLGGERADVQVARSDEAMARAQVELARSAALPQVGLVLRGSALLGGSFGAALTVGLGGRWELFAPVARAQVFAAERGAEAAALARSWTEAQAALEGQVARRVVSSAHLRVSSAREALAAAEAARVGREARHREGLLPLTELLDAEAAVTAARTTLLDALFAERFGRAQLAFALAQPIEGVTP